MIDLSCPRAFLRLSRLVDSVLIRETRQPLGV
ncbi:predicted protein [Streptomyces iranensis]|uniref:Uncharacterized protein n=1 Tax=Streptomyces iranensis TaxID=576784 RepID=A0A060ZZC8_9ACTN|nr:predicted protein [Streptomyces iranensis]